MFCFAYACLSVRLQHQSVCAAWGSVHTQGFSRNVAEFRLHDIGYAVFHCRACTTNSARQTPRRRGLRIAPVLLLVILVLLTFPSYLFGCASARCEKKMALRKLTGKYNGKYKNGLGFSDFGHKRLGTSQLSKRPIFTRILAR